MHTDDLLRRVLTDLAELKAEVRALAASPSLCTLDEAAKQVGLSVRTIQRGIAAGRYPVYGHGRAVRVNPQEILSVMRGQKGGGHAVA